MVLTVLGAAAALSLGGGVAGAGQDPRPSERAGGARTYVVRPGDTLWAIAERISDHDDPRRVVDALVRANRVDPAALVPGQVLTLPG